MHGKVTHVPKHEPDFLDPVTVFFQLIIPIEQLHVVKEWLLWDFQKHPLRIILDPSTLPEKQVVAGLWPRQPFLVSIEPFPARQFSVACDGKYVSILHVVSNQMTFVERLFAAVLLTLSKYTILSSSVAYYALYMYKYI